MKIPTFKNKPILLPESPDLSLYLIREELKIRKVFNALREIGFCDCYFEPHLDQLILASMGLDDGTDETSYFYYNVIEKRSRKIEDDNESIMQQAVKAYQELVNEKARKK